ncbi:hypothetical protein GBA52_015733 [Prunus armeniaca]|nr:hypothetical protein GBA52_015733 [Prunus armeniaca]
MGSRSQLPAPPKASRHVSMRWGSEEQRNFVCGGPAGVVVYIEDKVLPSVTEVDQLTPGSCGSTSTMFI